MCMWLSLFLPVPATRNWGPTSLCWGKYGLVQLSDCDAVCSPCYFLCLLHSVVARTLVCIISTRPTSLCIPTTRCLLCYCFFHIITSLTQLTKKQTIQKQKHDCQRGYHSPAYAQGSSKYSLKLRCLISDGSIESGWGAWTCFCACGLCCREGI